MTFLTRRAALFGAMAGIPLVAACNNGISGNGAQVIDARVQTTLNFMQTNYPGTRDLVTRASGMLVMPLVTEASFGVGGSYGRGSLLVDQSPVDYYSAAQASVGFQLGAQQYAHILFFMTDNALFNFRNSPGWEAGGDIEYVIKDQGGNASATTTTSLSPVIGVVFGQAGLAAGAAIEGTKYTRIIP